MIHSSVPAICGYVSGRRGLGSGLSVQGQIAQVGVQWVEAAGHLLQLAAGVRPVEQRHRAGCGASGGFLRGVDAVRPGPRGSGVLSPSQELNSELRRQDLLPNALVPVVRAQGLCLVLGRGDDEELCTLSRDAKGRYVASDANFDTVAKGVRPASAFKKLIAHVVDEHLPNWEQVTPAEADADLAVRGHQLVEVRADGTLLVTAAGRQLEARPGARPGTWILLEGGNSLHLDRDGAD